MFGGIHSLNELVAPCYISHRSRGTEKVKIYVKGGAIDELARLAVFSALKLSRRISTLFNSQVTTEV
jgi:hypothetical protein